MRDVLEEGGGSLKPLSVLALAATIIMGVAILYNAVLGQDPATGRPRFVASQITASGASTRVDVIASEIKQPTVILKYDPRIEEIQRGLLMTGDYKGLVDGVAGNRTRLAIESYQRKSGMAVDGKITDGKSTVDLHAVIYMSSLLKHPIFHVIPVSDVLYEASAPHACAAIPYEGE